jgi:threonine dehydratase
MNDTPTLAEFEDAAQNLRGIITRTPLDESLHLTELLGVPVSLKLENLQRTGSFKIRGATYRLSRLTAEERARGVVAASAGNHAQGVALAAQQLGIAATIFMPLGVPVPKLLATRGYGAEVILEGATVETPLRLAAEFAERTGAVLIHPFDHRDIVVGQGTLGLELVEDMPDLETVIVGIGGGGLAAGVAAAVKARAAAEGREVRIIGVQAHNSAAYPSSLAAGYPMQVETTPTIADGIAVARPGDLPFELIRQYVDEVVTVTEDDIARALLVGRRPGGGRGCRSDPGGQGESDRPDRHDPLGGQHRPPPAATGRGARALGIRSLHVPAHSAARPPGPARSGVRAARRRGRQRDRGAAYASRSGTADQRGDPAAERRDAR